MIRFSIATLAVFCFAGCGGEPAKPATYHLQVDRDPASDDQRQQTTLRFHSPPGGGLVVIEAHGHPSVMSPVTAKNREKDYLVQLIAERQENSAGGKSKAKVWLGFAGNEPSIHWIDADQPLPEFLNVTITDGDFALDERVELGTLNDRSITLVIRSAADQDLP